jgi:streptogramin lyase
MGFRKATSILLLVCAGCGASLNTHPSTGSFSLVGKLNGIGYAFDAAIGPASSGKQRYYLPYAYIDSLQLIGVSEDGNVASYSSPVSELSGYGTLLGPDGNIYFGTAPHARVLRLNTASDQIEDIGGIPGEQYIWSLTAGSDGRIYGCTSPSAKLIRFDPQNPHLEDLGRMDSSEQYARMCVADHNGFIYIGLGSVTSNIVAYQIATGQHQRIIPSQFQVPGFAQIITDTSGQVHGCVGNRWFSLNGWGATPEAGIPTKRPTNVFADGTAISISGATVQLRSPDGTIKSVPYTYSGGALSVFRLGLGPDDALYASSALPFYLFKQTASGFTNIGRFGNGEGYSMLPMNGKLLIGAYAAIAPILSFDVARGFAPEPNPNPTAISYPKENDSWRPLGMVSDGDGEVYISSMAGYGMQSSPLTRLDLQTNTVTPINLLPDQSTTSVTLANNKLIVGTSIQGGLGTFPSAKQAMLILLGSNGKPESEIVPVAGKSRITNLISLPDGTVVGIADRTPFQFDTASMKINTGNDLPELPLDNTLVRGPDGNLWCLSSHNILRLHSSTLAIRSIPSPVQITSGMAIRDDGLYFGSGAEIYRFDWKSLGSD